jgi:hypothetical protein
LCAYLHVAPAQVCLSLQSVIWSCLDGGGQHSGSALGGGGDQKSKKAERRVSRKPVIESDTATVGMMPSGRRVTRLLCLFNIFLSQKAFFFFFIS